METFGSRVTALQNEIANCRKNVRELAASKRALDDKGIAAEERLKKCSTLGLYSAPVFVASKKMRSRFGVW